MYNLTLVPIFISESKSSKPLTMAANLSFVDGCLFSAIFKLVLIKDFSKEARMCFVTKKKTTSSILNIESYQYRENKALKTFHLSYNTTSNE